MVIVEFVYIYFCVLDFKLNVIAILFVVVMSFLKQLFVCR